MTVTTWRLVKARHRDGAFSGVGAKERGGRWNGKGSGVVYTAGALSLAILEVPSAAYQLQGDGPGESNYLLNPSHVDFSKIEVGPFRELRIDERLG